MQTSWIPVAGNSSIDRVIRHAFEALGDESIERRFRRAFKSYQSDNWQQKNLFHELCFGGLLANQGYRVTHEPLLDGMTPDWLADGLGERFILEVATKYVDRSTFAAFESGKVVCIDDTANGDRMRQTIEDKLVKYRQLTENQQCGLVIGIHVDFSLPVSKEEILAACSSDSGQLLQNPALSGLLLRSDGDPLDTALYVPNSTAARPVLGLSSKNSSRLL